MKNIFEKENASELIERIEELSPKSNAQWGKMNVSQMLKHCSEGFKMAKGEINPKRVPVGYVIGRLIKKTYYSPRPYPKNLPTAKELIAVDVDEFEKEKNTLIKELLSFSEGGEEKCTTAPHAMFGKLKPIEWSMGMFKHLNHHLTQFGK